MAFITVSEARQAYARSVDATRGLTASAALSTKARSAPLSKTYDIFLSHSFTDATVIAGLAVILERLGMSVYVDWREDGDLSRSAVTPATAARIRDRMKNCRSLLFATSESSPNSRWMPWELGYFDGLRGRFVAILPLVQTSTGRFVGQEYLSLYPKVERDSVEGQTRYVVVDDSRSPAPRVPLVGFVKRQS